MKLKQLFLASLAACTLASCSKDDNGISGPQEVDAYLSFAATTDLMTRSGEGTGGTATDPNVDANATGKEDKIQSLTAYVFDENGKYVISKHVSFANNATEGTESEDYDVTGSDENKSITSIKGIHVKVAKPTTENGASSTTFKVVLLANIDRKTPHTLDELKSDSTLSIVEKYNDGKVGESYLPMHSGKFDESGEYHPLTVTGLKYNTEKIHVMNWCNGTNVTPVETTLPEDGKVQHTAGAPNGITPVTMTRSISRVQFVSLSSTFKGQYANVTFYIDSIYLANVRRTATVIGGENKNTNYLRGGLEEFAVKKGLIDPTQGKDAVHDKLGETYGQGGELLSNNNSLTQEKLHFDKYINANAITGGDYLTRLIITGNLYDGDRESGRKLGKKYFHIPLKDGSGNVASNKFFKITATITGEGSPDPDEILENACINFTIKVDPWVVIEQTENDTN